MAATLTSIRGLQNLTNLQELNLDWSSLTEVDLSGMSSLIYVDISDQNSPNVEEDNCLTSVNLSGCTAIEELRLDDNNFSNGMPDLTGLNELRVIDFDQCGIIGTVDISGFPLLERFDFNGNEGLNRIIISSSQPLGSNDLDAFTCALTQTAVNNILIALAANVIDNGYIDLTGGTNAIPGASGLAAKATLEGRGWNVYVNS